MRFNPADHPHRRLNYLTGEWVQISPQRTQRPWRGQLENRLESDVVSYDPSCYLCPGNERAGGLINPSYENTYVFDNDFPALLAETPEPAINDHPLLQLMSAPGICRVVCFSPRHDLTLPEMNLEQIGRVVDVWAKETAELGRRYRWVQLFENKGAAMGSSNPHPHGQLWAIDALPNEPAKEERQQRDYFRKHNRPLLLEYASVEEERQQRVVLKNEHWLVVVPYWAIWPFETLLLPRQHRLRLPDLDSSERHSLASVLKRLLTKYDNLFQAPFPYSMGWHGAPYPFTTGSSGRESRGSTESGIADNSSEHWTLHAHFYPPLLRSASVRKFMVGYELMAEAQRDLTAEQAAARLRDMPERHYKVSSGS
jgi:UDPglucose--hexose-1-phosphate uridylyltransferase